MENACDASIYHPSVTEGLERHGISARPMACDPDFADTALFCERYNYALSQSANAIIVASKSEPVRFACCIILATTKLDVNKTVRNLLDVRKASFATAEQTVELTGMQIGGVTPFGLPDIPIYIDSAVMTNQEVVAGGGNRSSKVLLDPKELTKLPNSQVIEGLALPKVNKGEEIA